MSTTWVTVTGDLSTDECGVGCWVDGHWGQYAGDHLADKIDHILRLEPDDDPRELRRRADLQEEASGYKLEPICGTCGHELQYRRDRDRWVHVRHYRNTQIRLELDHTDCAATICTWPSAAIWEARTDAIDKIEERLNDATPEGWMWHWLDGEFYLSPYCGDAFDCNDDDCVCHREG